LPPEIISLVSDDDDAREEEFPSMSDILTSSKVFYLFLFQFIVLPQYICGLWGTSKAN